MSTPIYDISAERGVEVFIEFLYENADESGVNLEGLQYLVSHGVFQVRRSNEETSTDIVLEVNDATATVEGVTGWGGAIVLSHEGITGNVLLLIEPDTMAIVPAGKYFYELQLVSNLNPVKLVRGRFIVEHGGII